MAGYCIELYKYMRVDENKSKKNRLIEMRRNIIDSGDKRHEYGDFLAYGEFDRIGIERVEKFSRFRDVSERARTWIGDRQTILLYEINEEMDDVIYRDNSFYHRSGLNLQQSDRLFIGITILQFKYSQKRENEDMNRFFRNCQKKILNLVKEEYEDLECSVLGMLGSFGLTLFWLADQYVDVLNAVTKIRKINLGEPSGKKSKSEFLSAYTIFAQNHPMDEKKDKRRKKIDNILGNAVLHLTLKRGINNTVIKTIKEACQIEEELYHSTGEYDIIAQMESKKAFYLFQQGEVLYCDSEFFQNNILQTSLQLCECFSWGELGEDNQDSADEGSDYEQSPVPFLGDIQEKYSRLRKQFKEEFPSTAGMVDTLDLLYSDYIAKISTASNEMWESNFSYQFLKILECLNEFIENKERVSMPRESVLLTINEILGDFERQISHIAESNNLVLGTPTCQFRYSGNNNLTLYAYFEFIKETLDFIYSVQEKSNQAEIVPLIVGDIVPIIQSTLFIDYNNKEDSRIVTINLPMGALYNPVFYFPYLYHEIFHYVVPRDRYIRNEIVGILMSIEILNSIARQIFIHDLKLNKEEVKIFDLFLNKYLLRHTYSFVVSRFEEDIDPSVKWVSGKEVSVREANEQVKDAEQYEKNLFQKWVNWANEEENVQLNNNPIQLYLLYLFENQQEISEEFDDWSKQEVGEEDKSLCGKLEKIKVSINIFGQMKDNTDAVLIDEAFAKWMSYINDGIVNNAINLVKAIKESMADLAMVQLMEMEFAEYLLVFTKIYKDLTINNRNISEKEVQDIIRVGVILEYSCRKRYDSRNCIGHIENCKENFMNLYCGLYYSAHNVNTRTVLNKLIVEAEEWYEYWVKCYKLYCYRYGLYSVLLRRMWEQSLATDQKFATVSSCWKEYIYILQEYGNYIRLNKDNGEKEEAWLEKRTLMNRTIFGLNMSLIHKYQAQVKFSDLNEKRKQCIGNRNLERYCFEKGKFDKLSLSKNVLKAEKRANNEYVWIYRIYSIGSLGTVILQIAERLKSASSNLLGNGEHPIWYRGHKSKDYKLLPSIMRKFKQYEEKMKDDKEATLFKMLRREYEEFKFRADGSYEMVDSTGYGDSDYIALMQHYSVASNFLDWTEDALSSLYFAVEEFMDEKAEKVDNDAALYIFSPALYNRVRIRMMHEAQKNDRIPMEIEKGIIREIPKEIPNLTAPYNKERYDIYMLGADQYKDVNIKPLSNEIIMDKAAYYSPMAIYTSRLNKRIQAQNGMFLAYNIYTPRSQKEEFDYISLERIQQDYLHKFKNDETTCPFLYKVIIQKDKKRDVAKWIKAFGMSKERCYPELSNIGERIMR